MANIWSSILTAGGQLLGGVLQGATQPPGYGGVYSGGYGGGVYSQPQIGPGVAMPGGSSPLGALVQQLGGALTVPGPRRPTIFLSPMGRPARELGAPLAWSGDVAACKRLVTAYARIGKALPHRRRRAGGR